MSGAAFATNHSFAHLDEDIYADLLRNAGGRGGPVDSPPSLTNSSESPTSDHSSPPSSSSLSHHAKQQQQQQHQYSSHQQQQHSSYAATSPMTSVKSPATTDAGGRDDASQASWHTASAVAGGTRDRALSIRSHPDVADSMMSGSANFNGLEWQQPPQFGHIGPNRSGGGGSSEAASQGNADISMHNLLAWGRPPVTVAHFNSLPGVDVGREVQLALSRGGGLDAWAANASQSIGMPTTWDNPANDEAMFDSLIQEDSFG